MGQDKKLLGHLDLLACPACQDSLSSEKGAYRCGRCGTVFPIEDGIPLLYTENAWDAGKSDVTEVVRSFYEETPFPNYDDIDDLRTLRDKARRSVFARLLDDQVPADALILECGCGTGQLTNFLAWKDRTVFGTDICLNSLRLGLDFGERNGLAGAAFLQMNLFRPCFRPGTFDLVISNGVLHHTSDPFLGFQTISRLARPGGHVLVGLYHKYGRILTDIRRFIFRLSGDRLKSLDPRLRDATLNEVRRRTWFQDQYKNPHESKHTIGEVLGWLEKAGLSFVRSIPSARLFGRFKAGERLFSPDKRAGRLGCSIKELSLSLTGNREGGFFTVIARRPE